MWLVEVEELVSAGAAALFVIALARRLISRSAAFTTAATARRLEAVLDQMHKGLDDFDKADEAHAEEDVQVAADGADERLGGDARLLLDERVGESIVEDGELDKVVDQIVLVVALIAMKGAERVRVRVGFELIDVVGRRRIAVGRVPRVQRLRLTLERTARQAEVGDVRARIESAHDGRVERAEVEPIDLKVRVVVGAVEEARVEQLKAVGVAGVARVGEVRISADRVIQRAVGGRMHKPLIHVARAHRALAICVRPLVELGVKDALHGDARAHAGREEERRRRQVERKVRVIANVNIEALYINAVELAN